MKKWEGNKCAVHSGFLCASPLLIILGLCATRSPRKCTASVLLGFRWPWYSIFSTELLKGSEFSQTPHLMSFKNKKICVDSSPKKSYRQNNLIFVIFPVLCRILDIYRVWLYKANRSHGLIHLSWLLSYKDKQTTTMTRITENDCFHSKI